MKNVILKTFRTVHSVSKKLWILQCNINVNCTYAKKRKCVSKLKLEVWLESRLTGRWLSPRMLFLRIHWWFSTILETSNKIVWSNVFWYIKVESVKLCALRARHVLTCVACLRAHVPTCLACLCVHVPTCVAYLLAHVPTCLASSDVNEVIRAVLNSLFFLQKDFTRTKSTKSTKTQLSKSTKT